MVVEVVFAPYLGEGVCAGYELKETFPQGAFAMDVKALKDAGLPFEFLSWHVSRPTKALDYQVNIPKSLVPVECGHDVWYRLF